MDYIGGFIMIALMAGMLLIPVFLMIALVKWANKSESESAKYTALTIFIAMAAFFFYLAIDGRGGFYVPAFGAIGAIWSVLKNRKAKVPA